MKTLLSHKIPAEVKGILLMMVAVALIAVMNMCAKLATDYHDPVEKVFYRGVVALLLVMGIMVVTKRFAEFKTERLLGQIGRAIAGTMGVICVYWSYSLMPMADVTALLFSAGFMTLIMSSIFLGEKVGFYRISAVVIGFIGAIIIAQPSSENFNGLGVFASLTAAFFGGGLVAIFLRSLGRTEPAYTTVFYFLFIGLLITFPYMLIYGNWVHPNALMPLLGAGLAGGLSLLIKTQAYRYAEASTLSVIHYTGIVWAVLFDMLIWNLVPSANIFIGATIIIFANLFILWREQKKKHEVGDVIRDT